ncbi:MAG: ABC transporter substrate-binding protein, partial [Halobacteriovoraceae bacterium]|nr:ABC transporter substrate-binding protein [Halobacteriovoraceae bacterium]
MHRLVCSIILLALFCNCAGVKVIRGERKDLYRSKFLKHISKIKKRHQQGYLESSLRMLKAINPKTLWTSEKIMRRNLMAEVLFSMGQYEKAIYHINLAFNRSQKDDSLTAKLYLNLAKSYHKMGLIEKAFDTLRRSDHQVLMVADAKTHHQLMYRLARETNHEDYAIVALALYLRDKRNIDELKVDPYFEHLLSNFKKLSQSEKWNFLEKFEGEDLLSIAYVAYLEMERLYYKGDKSGAEDILDWIDGKFNQREILELVRIARFREDNFTQMDPNAIGVLLPLSGRQKRFGHRALLGIDNGMRNAGKKSRNLRIFIRDSKGSGAVGAFQVQQLVEKHHVSAIIGGLFSSEAQKEYKEAIKHGVFYISLSPVYLPKNEKNHLLLEIPGSVESQLHKLFSSEMLDSFGRKAAIIYPRGD